LTKSGKERKRHNMLYYMQYAAAGVESNVPTGVLPSGSRRLTDPAAAD
jgi:hypothetical protein